jgi:hypothetical protein
MPLLEGSIGECRDKKFFDELMREPSAAAVG